MSREIIKINKADLLDILLYKGGKTEDFSFIENIITGSDPEDGGADHILILKRNSDSKFFKLSYTDWDSMYDSENFPEELSEVFPEQVTITQYI